MSSDTRPFVDWRERAACATDEGRALVDASFERKGLDWNKALVALCARCPVADHCLASAMRSEPGRLATTGMWAGTTQNTRSRRRQRQQPRRPAA